VGSGDLGLLVTALSVSVISADMKGKTMNDNQAIDPKKNDIELTEEELAGAAGGAAPPSGAHSPKPSTTAQDDWESPTQS
jgi:hypothetical protein